jgi:hypothetical protein
MSWLDSAGILRAIPGCREDTDMAGPSWLAGIFAAVMILTGAYSASRLAISRLRGRATEFDADALHAVMGAAMAGMLVPRLNVLPASAWVAVFGIAAAWFGWHAVRTRGLGAAAYSPRSFPVPHLIECAAMLYMLLSAQGSRPVHGGDGMAGMGASAGPAGSFPALAAVLALFMLGYVLWTTDRLTTLARAKTAATSPGRQPDRQPAALVSVAAPIRGASGATALPAAAMSRHHDPAGRPMLAPKLAACGKIAMSITMGYMLILML